jgi:hypothetical protein
MMRSEAWGTISAAAIGWPRSRSCSPRQWVALQSNAGRSLRRQRHGAVVSAIAPHRVEDARQASR